MTKIPVSFSQRTLYSSFALTDFLLKAGEFVKYGVAVSLAKESRSLLHLRGKFLDSNNNGYKGHNCV
jgi:hypothetical protein